MAKDQTQIAVGLAVAAVQEAGKLANALDDAQEVQDWRNDAGITDFATYESEFTGNNELQHIDGALANKFLGKVILDVITYLETTTVSTGPYDGNTYMEIVQMMRRS